MSSESSRSATSPRRRRSSATRASSRGGDTGVGVLFIVKNYEGDVMKFDMAREMAGKEAATVITDDDVAVETST
jgi:dihydroxyacetone kinase-like protein